MRKDSARLKREGPKVINLLRELARLARKNTTKGANYSEMHENRIAEKITDIEEQQNEL